MKELKDNRWNLQKTCNHGVLIFGVSKLMKYRVWPFFHGQSLWKTQKCSPLKWWLKTLKCWPLMCFFTEVNELLIYANHRPVIEGYPPQRFQSPYFKTTCFKTKFCPNNFKVILESLINNLLYDQFDEIEEVIPMLESSTNQQLSTHLRFLLFRF